MGRAGAGGGGGHSSGGGFSSGRSGGGLNFGGSSGGGHRAGSGGGSVGGGPRGGGFGGAPRNGGPRGGGPRGGFGGPVPPPHRGGFGGPVPPPPRRRRGYGYGCGSFLATIVVIFIIAMVLGVGSCSGGTGYSSAYSGSSAAKSTIVREKLDSGNAYINDCIIDEIGWFNNISKTESQLKDFWEKTGVQPYIILKAYDPSLTTDSQKDEWATDYYDDNFNTENIFLYVYFAEQDTDNDVGYMAYANGYQTSSVMDSEALEIFSNNLYKYWYTDVSTDTLFVNAFNDTASTIMHVSTTGKDIFKWILIIIAIVIIASVVIYLVRQKNKRAKEKAEEDQRILNTPINDLAKDDLENKYLNNDK